MSVSEIAAGLKERQGGNAGRAADTEWSQEAHERALEARIAYRREHGNDGTQQEEDRIAQEAAMAAMNDDQGAHGQQDAYGGQEQDNAFFSPLEGDMTSTERIAAGLRERGI